MKTVFITKYALTDGILQRDTVGPVDEERYVTVVWPDGLNGVAHFGRNDWYDTRDFAVKRAEQMRQAKIKSLQKQITKLEAMKFE